MESKYSNFGNVSNVINSFDGIRMYCTKCEDSGYIFDTLHACDECDLGKPIQHEYNERELERLKKDVKFYVKKLKNIISRRNKRKYYVCKISDIRKFITR